MEKNIKPTNKITRKEAIRKAGVTALTASSLLFLSAQDGPVASINTITKPGENKEGENARIQRH